MKHCDKLAVTVNPTNKCNLRCSYCMASSAIEQARPIYIDIEFAKCGIKDAIQGYPTGIHAKVVRFFSPGESTQYMECLKECVLYAKSLNSEIKIELQTNGLFNSDKDLDWIANNVDIVWFSLDGPKEVNRKYRPDEHGYDRTEEIEKNLKCIQKHTFVGVRATIVEETVEHQDTIVEYYNGLGITYIYANPIIESIKRDIRNNNGPITQLKLMRFAKGFLKGHEKAEKLGIYYGNSLIFNFDEETDVSCRSCLPMPQLNPDGSVASCDMAMYKNAPSQLQCFLYGEWDPLYKKIKYDINKIKYLQNRKINNIASCKNCEIKHNCAGGCVGRVAYEMENIYSVVPAYCAATKYLAHHLKLNENKVLYSHP